MQRHCLLGRQARTDRQCVAADLLPQFAGDPRTERAGGKPPSSAAGSGSEKEVVWSMFCLGRKSLRDCFALYKIYSLTRD
jgi:hypothetical protein